MKIRHHHCPVCDSDKVVFFLKAEDHLVSHEQFSLWKCADCSFVFTQDFPREEEIGKYYQSQEYVSHSDSRKGLINSIYHFGRSLMLRVKFRMVASTTQSNRLMDYGCGTGYFPAFMKDKGFDVTGVEVDEKAREFARNQFGINVVSPQDFLAGKIEGSFDVITMWHVLEHVEKLDQVMLRLKAYLSGDGVLVIALPNCSSLDARFYKENWAAYDVPRHLWHFTPSAFEKLALKHGMKITGMKRLVLDPFYNSMLSEKQKGNKFYFFAGIIIGKLAYLESLINKRRSSSVVYLLRKS